MSIEAITWALSAQVGDTTRKMVLIGYANHAHRDGRHAWASKDTIAEYAECSNKTVRRHVAALIADGWMREGDQAQVQHLRADRRPVVYDIAMSETTRLQWKDETARGDNLTTRTEGHPAPSSPLDGGTPATGREDATGGHTGGQRRPNGGTRVTPKPSTNLRTTPQPPASGGRSCARHDAPQPNCRGCGTTNRQLAEAERKAAEQARREAELRELRERRARAEEIRARRRSPDVEAVLEQTRKTLATTRSSR